MFISSNNHPLFFLFIFRSILDLHVGSMYIYFQWYNLLWISTYFPKVAANQGSWQDWQDTQWWVWNLKIPIYILQHYTQRQRSGFPIEVQSLLCCKKEASLYSLNNRNLLACLVYRFWLWVTFLMVKYL